MFTSQVLHTRSRSLIAACAVALIIVASFSSTTYAQKMGAATASGDFNNDGLADFAIAHPDSFRVEIVYGRDNRIRSSIRREGTGYVLSHKSRFELESGVRLVAVDGGSLSYTFDRDAVDYGHSLAVGDFDGDQYDDLVVGAPGDTHVRDLQPGMQDRGSIVVFYGSSAGLRNGDSRIFKQGGGIERCKPESGDRFGEAVAAGDLNQDGYDDIAVGAPGEDGGKGVVHVIFGSSRGLTDVGDRLIFGDQNAMRESGDRFGASLAIGHFAGTWRAAHLAIGVPREDIGSIRDCGSLVIVRYSRGRFYHTHLNQHSNSVNDNAEAYDYFSQSLVVGDFNNDNRDDLAVGIPGERVSNRSGTGAVQVFYGRANSGLGTHGQQFWSQDIGNVPDFCESYDRFGTALAAGDLNGDGADDLAIGIPYEDIGGFNDGAVQIIFGRNYWGLGTSNAQLVHQNSWGMDSWGERFDYFGTSMAIGDWNGDSRGDLIIGAPGEDSNRGACHLLLGTSGRMSTNDTYLRP